MNEFLQFFTRWKNDVDAIERITSDEKAKCYISYQTFEGLKLTGNGGTILFVLSSFLESYPILNKISNKAAFIIMVRETRLYMFQLNSYEKLNNFLK